MSRELPPDNPEKAVQEVLETAKPLERRKSAYGVLHDPYERKVVTVGELADWLRGKPRNLPLGEGRGYFICWVLPVDKEESEASGVTENLLLLEA